MEWRKTRSLLPRFSPIKRVVYCLTNYHKVTPWLFYYENELWLTINLFKWTFQLLFRKYSVFLGNNNSKLDNSAHIPYCWAPIPTIGTTDIRTPVNLALRVNIKTREPTIWNMYRSNMETLTFTKKMDTITQWFHYLHWYKLYKEIYPSFCLMLSIFPINRHESFHS